jgi:hypothetical protein
MDDQKPTPQQPAEVIDAPSLRQLLADERKLRDLLRAEAIADDELAVWCRERGEEFPARRVLDWPPFLALHELRQVERRIEQLKEAIHGR